MVIKAVVFDLDGTLADFNLDYKAVRTEVRNLMMKAGVAPSLLGANESIFEMLKKSRVFLRNSGISEEFISMISGQALSIAEEYEMDAARTTSLKPGVNGTLKTLKEMNLRIGLFTINSKRSVNRILKRFRLSDFFDAVIPRNAVGLVKPNAEHLQVTLEALEASPRETLVVGDGVSDMECAREIEAVAVGLPTGFFSYKDLLRSGANYVITSLMDLPILVRRLNIGEP